MKLKQVAIIALIGCGLALLFSSFFSVDAKDKNQLQGIVKIDGSSTVFPITEAVAELFQQQHKKVKVTVGISGSGGGFKKFQAGEIDISNSSRPIKPSEIEASKKNKIEFIELPLAYDGLSILVNSANKFVDKLTIAQLEEIWKPDTKVTHWDHIDKAWPHEKINLYGPGPDSGTFDFFTERVLGKSGRSTSNYTSSEDDNVIVRGVSHDKNALGYFGYAYYLENQSKLKLVPIDDGKGAVSPTDKTIEDGSYPLSRPLFLYVSVNATQKKEVDEFVKFYLSNAKQLSKEVGYIPLPDEMYNKIMEHYSARKTGSAYTH